MAVVWREWLLCRWPVDRSLSRDGTACEPQYQKWVRCGTLLGTLHPKCHATVRARRFRIMNLNPAASKLTLCGSFLVRWCVRKRVRGMLSWTCPDLVAKHKTRTGTHSNYCPYPGSRGDHTHTLAQRPRPHQARRQAIEALSTARPVIASVRRAALDARRPLEHGQLTVLLSPPTTPPPSLLMYERTPWPPPQRHHSFVFTRTLSQPTTRH